MSGDDVTERILIYGMNYAPEIAGVGRYTGEIAEHFASLGYSVQVVTTHPHYPGWIYKDGVAKTWLTEHLKGVTIYRCPLYLHKEMEGFRRFLAPFSFALSSAPIALWRILASRPNVVIAVEPTLFVAPTALIAAYLVKAKTVLHVQDLEVDAAFAVGHLRSGGLIAKIAQAFDGFVNRKFDRIITIADAMAARIAAKGVEADRIAVVRNWVDLDKIRPVTDNSAYRNELNISNDDFVVLYSGNIGAKQGVRLLVESAERLITNQKIKFVIAGAGPMRRELEAKCAVLPNLRVLDFQPASRFSDFLGIADLHVLPQERNAADLLLPSKLGGMLASGKPILVTADPGTELANFLGESCYLTAPGDSKTLAIEIERLLLKPDNAQKCQDRLRLAQSLSMKTAIVNFTRSCLFLD